MQQLTSTLGSYLRQLRKERRLTQVELARKSGVSPRTISAVEKNRRSGKAGDLTRLSVALDVDLSLLVSHPGRRLFRSPLDEHFRQRAYWRPLADREGIQRKASLECLCPDVLRPLLDCVSARPDAGEARSLLSLLANDSGPEWLVFLNRLGAGDWPTSLAPLQVGYRQHPVIDPLTRKSVGDCPIPGVAGEAADMRFLLLPHVGIATPKLYTLDILLIVQANGERYEIDLEIDGSGHRGEGDERRRRDIRMLEIRFTGQQVMRADFNTLFLTEVARLCRPAA